MNRVQKVGLIVILLPALSVVLMSVMVELLPSHGTHMSAWQRVAPFALYWGIGLGLVVGSFLFIKWAAAPGNRSNSAPDGDHPGRNT